MTPAKRPFIPHNINPKKMAAMPTILLTNVQRNMIRLFPMAAMVWVLTAIKQFAKPAIHNT